MRSDLFGSLRRAVIRTLAAIGLLFLLVTFTPFVSWYANRLGMPWSSPEGDVLVVLSGASPNVSEGQVIAVMDPGTYWRCFIALLYNREHPYKMIVVSGRNAAPGMRDFLVYNGVAPDRIRVEDRSANTHENAQFTAPLLAGAGGRVVLVTSDSHMFRARKCFAKLGVNVVASPAPDVVKRAHDFSARPQLFAAEMGETAGIIYYWLRGWI